MHESIRLESPIEFINIVPMNPLISKVQIKVCYVGDEPNRNRSVITKETAKEMANSLPGCPIVGFYNEATEDFEEHNRTIEISNGNFTIKDTTKPYGFVDLNAKVWFQKFLDDGVNEHEYLMTEGYIWTGQYPEAERIIEQGNNQSMELSEKFLDASWTKDINGKPQFFIINEAIISKLCILGEDCEPCFEGANITKPTIQFSLDDNFKQELYSMMTELKELLKEGGTPVLNTYAVEIGDGLWNALWDYLLKTYPDSEDKYCSKYCVEGIYEENSQKFAILRDRATMAYYRLDFVLSEENGFEPGEELIEVTKTYVPAETPQFAAEAVEEFIQNYKVNLEQEDTAGIEEQQENTSFAKKEEEEDEEVCPECGKPVSECTCEEEKKKYSLEEIPEYVELQTQYADLVVANNDLSARLATLEAENSTLKEFKAAIEKKEKQAMIDSFYMLNDEHKKEVVENIDTYSLEDIEAKLSIICVRNRISFNAQEEEETTPATTYTLGGAEEDETSNVPAWVRAVRAVENNKN